MEQAAHLGDHLSRLYDSGELFGMLDVDPFIKYGCADGENLQHTLSDWSLIAVRMFRNKGLGEIMRDPPIRKPTYATSEYAK